MALLAGSFGLGCALTLSGVLPPRTLLPLLILLLPIGAFLRPRAGVSTAALAPIASSRGALLSALGLCLLAGSLRTAAWQAGAGDDCRLHVPNGWSGTVEGRFVSPAGDDVAALLSVEAGLGAPACTGVVRAYLDGGSAPAVGAPVRASGIWRSRPPRAWTTPENGGYLVLREVESSRGPAPPAAAEAASSSPDLRDRVVRFRGRVQERLTRLYGPLAPVTEALLLARRERMDPELRDRFARAGIAHLLAISGFHVGIIAGLLVVGARLLGAGPRSRPLIAASGAWAYVLSIGSPDAAVRAALLLGLLALGPLRGRPVSGLGGLATAFMGFLLVDPGALGRVGFQLSFAGVLALILWSRRATEEMEAGMLLAEGVLRGRIGRLRPAGAASALGDVATAAGSPVLGFLGGAVLPAAGAAVAATVGTLPLVAWHFGQVPLLGIPATLALGPLVALAVPGILATLAVDAVSPAAAGFLAGGVGLLLEGVVRGAGWVAALQGDAGWVGRPAWVLALAGGAVAWGGVSVAGLGPLARLGRGAAGPGGRRAAGGPGGADGGGAGGRGRTAALRARALLVSRWARRGPIVAGVVGGILLAPVVGGSGTATGGAVEIAVVDVGQGDAIAVRSPAGRWVLVDAGPRSPTFDAGERRVVPFLRRAGVERLEALVLTHPDLDHIGGAPAVLRSLEVGAVLDPGLPFGRGPFAETLAAAGEREVGWWPAGSRPLFELDGVELRVLYPPAVGSGPAAGGAAETDAQREVGAGLDHEAAPEANDLSVVLLLRYGDFRALLTGDAPASVERAILSSITGPVQLLKVGHHGSLTSTSTELLEALAPEVAVVPVGWSNRYGHPHPTVLDRLGAFGVDVRRTDLSGTVVVRGRADGSWSVRLPDR